MYEKLTTFFKGFAGISLAQIAHDFAPDNSEASHSLNYIFQIQNFPLDDIVKNVIQIIIGIVTLWMMLKKKKTLNDKQK